jgi:hypothetical protein
VGTQGALHPGRTDGLRGLSFRNAYGKRYFFINFYFISLSGAVYRCSYSTIRGAFMITFFLPDLSFRDMVYVFTNEFFSPWYFILKAHILKYICDLLIFSLHDKRLLHLEYSFWFNVKILINSCRLVKDRRTQSSYRFFQMLILM